MTLKASSLGFADRRAFGQIDVDSENVMQVLGEEGRAQQRAAGDAGRREP